MFIIGSARSPPVSSAVYDGNCIPATVKQGVGDRSNILSADICYRLYETTLSFRHFKPFERSVLFDVFCARGFSPSLS